MPRNQKCVKHNSFWPCLLSVNFVTVSFNICCHTVPVNRLHLSQIKSRWPALQPVELTKLYLFLHKVISNLLEYISQAVLDFRGQLANLSLNTVEITLRHLLSLNFMLKLTLVRNHLHVHVVEAT
jgi:hypothetical protein